MGNEVINRSSVRKFRKTLREILYPSSKMLNRMVSDSLLTSEQMEKVLSRATMSEKNDELISCLMKTPSDQLNIIVNILNDTGQSHVANFIRSDGGKLELFIKCVADLVTAMSFSTQNLHFEFRSIISKDRSSLKIDYH